MSSIHPATTDPAMLDNQPQPMTTRGQNTVSSASIFFALLKREYWEHRGSFWTSQLWTTGILLVLMLLSILIGEAFRLKFVGNVDIGSIYQLATTELKPEHMAEFRRGLSIGLWGLGMLNQMILYFVVLFYCINTLYDERKDRSILFWKSLPATDTQTVLSKLVTAILIAPVLAIVAIAALHVGFVLMIWAYAAIHGINATTYLWQPDIYADVWLRMLSAIPVHMLWAIPGIAWLLLASSWAKRAPFIWAILVPVLAAVVTGMLETLIRLKMPSDWFWEHIVARIFTSPGSMSLRPWEWRSPENPFAALTSWERMQQTLTASETWIGLLVGAGLLAAAIWLRRYRDDS